MIALETRHFGPVQVDENEVLIFPEGIPGFEDSVRFVLLGKTEAEIPFFWLQSIDHPEIAFVVVDPFTVYEDYQVNVDDSELDILGIGNPERILTLCIVVIPEDIKQMRANLKAPILINMDTNTGKQVLQNNDSLPVRYFLIQ